MRNVLIVGDGKSAIIDKNFIDYMSKNNEYKFDILSFKEITSDKYNKIYSIKEVKNSKFHILSSLYFLLRFIFKGIRLIRKYDIVHFHMFYPGIFFLAPFFKNKTILTLWGSDFLKASNIKKVLLGYVLKKTNIITCTNESFSTLIKDFYPFSKSKIFVLPYMLKYIDLINSSFEHKKISEKIRIVVGSNSNVAQNHQKILRAIRDSTLKSDNLHIIVPFSYGRGSEEYKSKIENQLKTMRLSYEIINRRLNDFELTNLRLNSDVFINLQDSDQLSGAMLETLCANNIVITGTWLEYNILKDLGVVFYEVKKTSDLSKLLNTLNFKIVLKNRDIIVKNYLPYNILNKWRNIYNGI